MKLVRRLFQFPVSFLAVYPPVWLGIFVVLVGADLYTKKLATDNLTFHLGYHQHWLIEDPVNSDALRDGLPQYDVLGEDGKYVKFRLVFNDRFVFGLGPSAPVLGLFLTMTATFFLILYRWHNPRLGYSAAWLLVFSGAFGNLIDKFFIKSLVTREWVFSLSPQPGYVSGVVDMVECIWFGWDAVRDIFLLNMLSMRSWPTFNLADSLIVVGIVLLLLSMREFEAEADEGEEAPAKAESASS
ncbi:MAG: signal peptidase II [bacterium]|nr:signal peptidase II [bacterium]